MDTNKLVKELDKLYPNAKKTKIKLKPSKELKKFLKELEEWKERSNKVNMKFGGENCVCCRKAFEKYK